MNTRKHIALATSAAVLGSGLVLAGATGATASAPHSTAAVNVAQQHSARPVQALANRCLIWYKSGWATAGYYTAVTTYPIVKEGASGDVVKEIQCLIDYSLPNGWSGAMDGQFGPATKAAVQAVQAQSWCNTTRDGIVGPATWKCLRY
ncbi:peptidoglycan-binding domain-containing protein [Streptomyces sp. NPDC056159]|uniref:peptidoglycan-binding domain-containing protein n=1 Tax=Streptomyces sp. NPDC056159 TaxID=3155537 RepID=UPI0034330664